MKLSLIAAVGNNLELGAENRLLWHLPDDFKWFIKHTLGKPVLMGRRTMESLGKPLKGRRNLVVSSRPEVIPAGFEAYPSIPDALRDLDADSEVSVIGGANIYKQCLPLADSLILTRVDAGFKNADVFFPDFDKAEWKLDFSEFHHADDKHAYPFTFEVYSRLQPAVSDSD